MLRSLEVRSLDVIVPSFRVQKDYILPIINLEKPEGVIVNFYIIVDNPSISINTEILDTVNGEDIHLIINKTNLGASLTRNVGIEAGTGEWILFLDDDIDVSPDLLYIYKETVDTYREEIGFIGLVTLPPAETEFTKATLVSGSVSIFNIAEATDSYAWGATANIAIKREALGPIRFLEEYPKSGGGEDIDFFLRIRKRNNYKNLKTVKRAQVWHPWWNNGKPNFKRPFRYGNGTAFLMHINPEYTRYDFPSTPEALVFTLVSLVLSLFLFPNWSYFIGILSIGIVFIEIIASMINLLRKTKGFSLQMLFYVIAMKFCYDAGILVENLSQGFFKGIFRRFNYSGIPKKDHFIRLNLYKITKLVLFLILAFVLFNSY